MQPGLDREVERMFVSEAISYPEMVAREKASLQRGMSFGIRRSYSIILMSIRVGAPGPFSFGASDGKRVMITVT